VSKNRFAMGFSVTTPLKTAIATAIFALITVSIGPGAAGAVAADRGPDRAFRTPVARSAEAISTAALSERELRISIDELLRPFGTSAGGWVKELGDPQALFESNSRRPFPIASNTKLFTTGTALTRLGPDRTLSTTIWSLGEVSAGIASGGIVIVGGGDPTLSGTGIAKLAKRIVSHGVKRISGPILFDASNFDRRTGVPQTGVSGGPYLGSLSGLSYGWGWDASGPMSDPARNAAAELSRQLKGRGVTITGKVKRAPAVVPRGEQLANLESPDLGSIAAATNAPSDNFLAEMLLKVIPDQLGQTGNTARGARIVERFASDHGSRISIENGSGLSRRNRATPAAVGRFLASMAARPAGVAERFRDSLAVAGRTGTLAFRMRGTAAEARCSGKTGTLNGVSALSGYCRTRSGGTTAFSLLFGGKVDISGAQATQDRITALIARFAG